MIPMILLGVAFRTITMQAPDLSLDMVTPTTTPASRLGLRHNCIPSPPAPIPLDFQETPGDNPVPTHLQRRHPRQQFLLWYVIGYRRSAKLCKWGAVKGWRMIMPSQ